MCICYSIGLLVKIVLYFHFLYTRDEMRDLNKLKRNMND